MNPGSCPACDAPLADDDRFCEACGVDLKPPETAISDNVPGDGAPCPSCGAASGITGGSDGYCEECGHRRPDGRDHAELEVAGAAGVSDRGLRHSRNEDAFALAAIEGSDGVPVVAAVICDGVSTTNGAADASLTATHTATAVLAGELRSGTDPLAATHAAVAEAARAVSALAPSGTGFPGAPSCTYVSAIVDPETVTAGWIGDCRVYWLGEQSARLTEDDSWAGQMIAAGTMSETDAYADKRAHVILRWLGADSDDVTPNVITFGPPGPGAVLVCSDGLWNYLPRAEDLAKAVPHAPQAPLAAARSLVNIALERGGHDNVSVAVIPFPPADPPAAVSETD